MDFMISSIEELRDALSLESIQKVVECEGVPPMFDEIARFLIEECVIVTRDGREYGFLNIEFYLYNKNHKDIITHPRISKALQW